MKSLKKQVGAYIGTSYMNSGIDSLYGPSKFPASATWPLATLAFDDNNVSVSILSNHVAVKYSDIVSVTVTKIGYVHVAGQDDAHNFGFGVFNIKKALNEFEKRGVTHERIATNNLKFANMTIYSAILFACVVLFLIVMSILRQIT